MFQGRRLAWLFAVVLLAAHGSVAVALGYAEGNAKTLRKPATLPAVFVDDLKYTPTYAYLVAVMRPAKMSHLEGVKGIPGADLAGANPVKPSEIERMVASIYPSGSPRGLEAIFVLQLRKDVPRDKLVAWLSPRAQPHQQDARIYLHQDSHGQSLVLGFPDDRTILASRDGNIVFRQMQASEGRSEEPHALASAFAQLDPESHVAAAVDVNRLIHFARVMLEKEVWLQREVLEPLAFAERVQLSVNLATPDGLILRVENSTTKDTEQLGKIAKATVAECLNKSIAALQESVGDRLSDRIESVQRRGRAIFEATTQRHDCESCTIRSRQLPSAADTLQLVSESVALHVVRLRHRIADLQFAGQMRSIGSAIDTFQTARRRLLRDIVSRDGKPLLSWRVAILPWVDEMELYKRFHRDAPWDSEHNLKLMREMPRVYQSRGQREPMKTSIQMVTGAGTAGGAKTMKEIKSPERTLAAIESQQLVEWTRPQDFLFHAQDPRRGLRSGGSFGVTCDGSQAYLSPKTVPAVLRAAFLIKGSKTDVERLLYQDNPFATSAPPCPLVSLTDARVKELLSTLGTGEGTGMLAALRLLQQPRGKLYDPRAQSVVDKVAPLLRAESPLTRAEALRTILAWRFEARVAWQEVAKLLKDRYDANRWLAVDILSEFAEPELVRAMLRLPEQDWEVAWPILYANYACIAADAVVPLLRDPDHTIRARACCLIGGLGSDAHVNAIEGMLKDEHEACRQAARTSLGLLKQKGPLAAAIEEFNGDIVAALRRVAKEVEVDRAGQVVALDLTQFRTSYPLARHDYRLLGKLRKLKRLTLTYSSITAEDVQHLKDLPLEELEINYCNRLDDAVADSLRTMTGLRILRLDETKVADGTAKAVGQLKNLRELHLDSTRVGDAGAAFLGKLPELEILGLSRTRISDKGLAAIAGLSTLQRLYLLDARISDASVENLARLTNLEFMNLLGSGVSAEGIARLRTALPQCGGLK